MIIGFGLYLQAQDLSCLFLWDGHTCGLWWGNTNLSVSAKETIRRDVQQVVASVPRSNVVFHSYSPGDEEFGSFTGWLEYTGSPPCPNGFTLNQFQSIGTTNVFFIGTNLCARYLGAISLTNQYKVSWAATSNFVATISTATLDNFSRNDLLELSWSINTKRAPTLDDISVGEYQDVVHGWQEFPFLPPVSVLDFEHATLFGKNWLLWVVRFKSGEDNEIVEFPVVYVNGKWRFATDSE